MDETKKMFRILVVGEATKDNEFKKISEIYPANTQEEACDIAKDKYPDICNIKTSFIENGSVDHYINMNNNERL
jgi:hypothetical protein